MSATHHRTCQHGVYRLSCAEFDELWQYSEGRCQICRAHEAETTRGRLVIDHAREYGWSGVRGLLCDKCNTLMKRIDAREINPHEHPAAVAYCYDAWFVRMVAKVRERYTR